MNTAPEGQPPRPGLTPPPHCGIGEDGLTRSEVSIELVFDSPGHVRWPIDDDEIIDRA
jgi:hypothetical protein